MSFDKKCFYGRFQIFKYLKSSEGRKKYAIKTWTKETADKKTPRLIFNQLSTFYIKNPKQSFRHFPGKTSLPQ